MPKSLPPCGRGLCFFRVEPRDHFVSLVNDHIPDGELEVFPEERVAYPSIEAIVAIWDSSLERPSNRNKTAFTTCLDSSRHFSTKILGKWMDTMN